MAARTASGQPLHTNPPRCTMPATRKFRRLISMGVLRQPCPPGGPPALHPSGSFIGVIFLILLNFSAVHITAARVPGEPLARLCHKFFPDMAIPPGRVAGWSGSIP